MTDVAMLLDAPPPPLAVRILAPALRSTVVFPRAVAGAVRATGRLAFGGTRGLAALARARISGRAKPPRAAAAALRSVLHQLASLHGVEVRVRGSFPEGPAVIVANHLGYLDPVVLGRLVPCTPLAKREVAGWPLVGPVARALGVLFVDRACARSGALALRAGLRSLRAGVPVLGFPEGSTTVGDRVLPFRRGMFGLARIADVPVVPVALRYETPEAAWVGDDAFVPHYLRTAARRRTVIEVQIGRPLHPAASSCAGSLAASARSYIEAMLRVPR